MAPGEVFESFKIGLFTNRINDGDNIQSCRQVKQLMLGVNIQLSRYALRLPRRDIRILIGLLIGHNTSSRHLTLLRRSDALCPLWEEEQETSLHVLSRSSATTD